MACSHTGLYLISARPSTGSRLFEPFRQKGVSSVPNSHTPNGFRNETGTVSVYRIRGDKDHQDFCKLPSAIGEGSLQWVDLRTVDLIIKTMGLMKFNRIRIYLAMYSYLQQRLFNWNCSYIATTSIIYTNSHWTQEIYHLIGWEQVSAQFQ